MTVVFEPFSGSTYNDVTVKLRRYRGYGSDSASSTGIARLRRYQSKGSGNGADVVVKLARYRTVASDQVLNGGIARTLKYKTFVSNVGTPTASIGLGQTSRYRTLGSHTFTEQGDMVVPLARYRTFATDMTRVGVARLRRYRGYASDLDPLSRGFVAALQSEGTLLAVEENPEYTGLHEHVGFSDYASARAIYGLSDTVGFDAGAGSVLQGFNQLRDALTLDDAIGAVYRILVNEGFTFGDTSSGARSYAAQLVDALHFFAGAGSSLTARNAVASALAFHDAIAQLTKESLADQIQFNSVFGTSLAAHSALLDQVNFGDAATPSVTMTAVVDESLDLGDSVTSSLTALSRLIDTIGLAVTISLGDSIYYAWVCNAKTKAFSQYENWPFNSMLEFGGKYYGMADDGLYELDGDDDAGTPIQARVRIGLSNMNTGKMKRMPSMYLGYASSGKLKLRVITTSPGGEKTENWYELPEQNAEVTREGRIKIGRGLKSVYWDFAIENLDGASFDIDTLAMYPMILDRRITGESNG